MANEKRLDLIDRNALMDSHWWNEMKDPFEKARAKIIIQSAKTVDAVEVVRCKDCKNAVDYPAGVYPFKADSQKLVCTKTVNWRAVEPDHFCSYGERRTE